MFKFHLKDELQKLPREKWVERKGRTGPKALRQDR